MFMTKVAMNWWRNTIKDINSIVFLKIARS